MDAALSLPRRVTAVPSWIDHVQAMKIGVNSRDLAQAQEQRRLWEANLECAQVQEIQRIKDDGVSDQRCPTATAASRVARP